MITNVMDKEPAACMIIVKELHDHQRMKTMSLNRKIISAIQKLDFVTINVMGPEHALNTDGAKVNPDDLYLKIPMNYLFISSNIALNLLNTEFVKIFF